MRALVTGATGFVGGRLAERLVADGDEVRCLVRDARRASALRDLGCELREGDVLDPASLDGAGRGADVAYYLVHAMGRGGSDEFEARERRAASAFARMARTEGVAQVVYLGGLGEPHSRHLRSRHETARILAAEGPPLTYLRAAMVVGAGSESFRTLYHLVRRLPFMVAPAWLRTRSQPIGIDEVVDYLAAAGRTDPGRHREVQIGGADVLTYADMLGEVARAIGRRPPAMLPVPLLTPTLSSLWLRLVTPVDTGIVKPLVEGLTTETVVTDPEPARAFGVGALPFAEAVRRAVAA